MWLMTNFSQLDGTDLKEHRACTWGLTLATIYQTYSMTGQSFHSNSTEITRQSHMMGKSGIWCVRRSRDCFQVLQMVTQAKQSCSNNYKVDKQSTVNFLSLTHKVVFYFTDLSPFFNNLHNLTCNYIQDNILPLASSLDSLCGCEKIQNMSGFLSGSLGQYTQLCYKDQLQTLYCPASRTSSGFCRNSH